MRYLVEPESRLTLNIARQLKHITRVLQAIGFLVNDRFCHSSE